MAPAASKLVAKMKKGDDDVDPTLKRIAALFELEKAIQDGTLTPNDERLAQTEFWSAMRSILARADQSSPSTFAPAGWRQGSDAPRLLDRGEASNTMAAASGKTPKPPKKQKLTLPNLPPIEPPPARAASMIDFELSPRAPVPLREDLEVLYVKAYAHGVTVYVMAYQWVEI
uniref:Uncharacterized protein n=1 Tax=Phytophthora fragariae TaxID=53985 RepID=A0A6A3F2L4_9STRA|nr:hypothetical protein PF009_g9971 [Phytophthora fragariae]